MDRKLDSSNQSVGLAGRIARAFINSKLTPLIIVTALLLGALPRSLLPREEEPQIKVPMIDVHGLHARHSAPRKSRSAPRGRWKSCSGKFPESNTSTPPRAKERALVIVRFKVGEDAEESLVKLKEKLRANFDRIPHGVGQPLIKPKSIDDVPILALTFHSVRYDHLTLRRLVAQVDDAVKQVPLVAETTIIGGARREVRVLLDPGAPCVTQSQPAGIVPMLQQANRQGTAGGLTSDNQEVVIETGAFLANAEDVGNVVVGVFGGRPVYLRDVARDRRWGRRAIAICLLRLRRKPLRPLPDEQPAVTLSIAKRPGANAISVANEVLKKVDTLKGTLIPADVQVSITRHYGETAAEKSNELLLHMGIAVLRRARC